MNEMSKVSKTRKKNICSFVLLIIILLAIVFVILFVKKNNKDTNIDNTVETTEAPTEEQEPKYYTVRTYDDEDLVIVSVYKEDDNGNLFVFDGENIPIVDEQIELTKEEWIKGTKYKNPINIGPFK